MACAYHEEGTTHGPICQCPWVRPPPCEHRYVRGGTNVSHSNRWLFLDFFFCVFFLIFFLCFVFFLVFFFYFLHHALQHIYKHIFIYKYKCTQIGKAILPVALNDREWRVSLRRKYNVIVVKRKRGKQWLFAWTAKFRTQDLTQRIIKVFFPAVHNETVQRYNNLLQDVMWRRKTPHFQTFVFWD